jgi:tRNA pseudouridine55 synthase
MLPVYKPSGMTSKDVSRRLLRRFGKLKIGHVGTLDPDAEGVLPVLIGNATKLQDYLLDMPKIYSFTVKLGYFTSTQDASGVALESKDFAHITQQSLKDASLKFLGKIQQVPPLYSAVKLDGKELYKHARSGVSTLSETDINRIKRDVVIYSIDLIRFSYDEFEMLVNCSKGTYVRTLAYDILCDLNTAGHVTKIRRDRSSGISLDDCLLLDHIENPSSQLTEHLIPTDRISIGLPSLTVNDSVLVQRIRDGQRVKVPESHGVIAQDVEGKMFLLKTSSGVSFGIGLVKSTDQGEFLNLKRGI